MHTPPARRIGMHDHPSARPTTTCMMCPTSLHKAALHAIDACISSVSAKHKMLSAVVMEACAWGVTSACCRVTNTLTLHRAPYQLKPPLWSKRSCKHTSSCTFIKTCLRPRPRVSCHFTAFPSLCAPVIYMHCSLLSMHCSLQSP